MATNLTDFCNSNNVIIVANFSNKAISRCFKKFNKIKKLSQNKKKKYKSN